MAIEVGGPNVFSEGLSFLTLSLSLSLSLSLFLTFPRCEEFNNFRISELGMPSLLQSRISPWMIHCTTWKFFMKLADEEF